MLCNVTLQNNAYYVTLFNVTLYHTIKIKSHTNANVVHLREIQSIYFTHITIYRHVTR